MLPEYPGLRAEPGDMGKQGFRETNWFKLGDINLDESDDEAPVPLPIVDRYSGAVSAEDSQAFGLHTGRTEHVRILQDVEPSSDDVSMKTLVGEMKVNKRRLGIGLAVSLASIASLVAFYV